MVPREMIISLSQWDCIVDLNYKEVSTSPYNNYWNTNTESYIAGNGYTNYGDIAGYTFGAHGNNYGNQANHFNQLLRC